MPVFVCLAVPELYTLKRGLGYTDGYGEPHLHLTEQPPAGQRCHLAWDTPRSRDTSKKPNWFSLLENTFEIKITSILARNKCFLSDPGKTEVPKFEHNLFPVFLRHKEYQKGRAETQEGKRRTHGVI